MDYFRARYKTLEDLPGLGATAAKQLREAGIHTVEGLATATLGEVTASGIGEATATKIIEAARRTMALTYITAEELAERRKKMRKLTTGCASLDAIMDGGLETQNITEFYGEYGAGKSQICQQLCVTVQLPEERGGLDGGALIIDTEQVFRPDRITQMAPRLGLDPGEALRRIVFAEAYTSSHQIVLLENADEVIAKVEAPMTEDELKALENAAPIDVTAVKTEAEVKAAAEAEKAAAEAAAKE